MPSDASGSHQVVRRGIKTKRHTPNTKCFSRIFFTCSLSCVMHKRHRSDSGELWSHLGSSPRVRGQRAPRQGHHGSTGKASPSLASTPEASKASLTASAGVVFARSSSFARMMVETQLGVRGEAEGETSEPDHPLQLGSSLRSASACSWTEGLALAGFVALAALVLSTRSSRALLPLPCAPGSDSTSNTSSPRSSSSPSWNAPLNVHSAGTDSAYLRSSTARRAASRSCTPSRESCRHGRSPDGHDGMGQRSAGNNTSASLTTQHRKAARPRRASSPRC